MRHLLAAATIGLLANVSHASLIGDQVTIQGFSPNISTINQTQSTTVTADASDALLFGFPGFGHDLSVDPFASGFVVDHIPTGSATFYSTGSFLEFTDLDWLPTPGEITGVNVVNNSNYLDQGLLQTFKLV